MLLWDGEDAAPDRTKALAKKLAAMPYLKAVWVAGVTQESADDLRAQVQRTFDCLGDRLIISGPDDLAQGMDEFRSRIVD